MPLQQFWGIIICFILILIEVLHTHLLKRKMVHKAFNKKWSNFSLLFLTLLTQPLSITFSFYISDLFIHECFACTYSVHPMCAWCPHRSEESIRYSKTGVADDLVPPCGCWETNLHLL